MGIMCSASAFRQHLGFLARDAEKACLKDSYVDSCAGMHDY
jgi:hypothetical protein